MSGKVIMPDGWWKVRKGMFSNGKYVVRYKPERARYWRIEDMQGRRLGNAMTASEAMAMAEGLS